MSESVGAMCAHLRLRLKASQRAELRPMPELSRYARGLIRAAKVDLWQPRMPTAGPKESGASPAAARSSHRIFRMNAKNSTKEYRKFSPRYRFCRGPLCAVCKQLFVPQRDHGIDAHRAPRRDIACRECNSGEDDNHSSECDRIRRADAVDEFRH